MEPVPARRGARGGAVERRVRAAGRAHGRLAARQRGLQLQRAGHRQHGGAAALRLPRAARALAGPAARGRDPLGVLHDRARRRLLGRDEHAGDRDARGRGGGAQRAQVVEHRRRAPELPRGDLHGPHRPAGRPLPPALDGARPAGHPRGEGRADAHHDGLRRRPRRARRGLLHRRAPAGQRGDRRARAGVRDRAGAPRPGPRAPLHAPDRPRRAGAEAGLHASQRARRVRQAAGQPRRQPRADRRRANRDRPGAPARAARRVADRPRGGGRAIVPRRGLPDQGRGPEHGPARGRHGDAAARRRRASATTSRSARPGRWRGRCASRTAPTRCTAA